MKKIILILVFYFTAASCFGQTLTCFTSKMLISNGVDTKTNNNPGWIRLIKIGVNNLAVEYQTELIKDHIMFYKQNDNPNNYASLVIMPNGRQEICEFKFTQIDGVSVIYTRAGNLEYLFRIDHIE